MLIPKIDQQYYEKAAEFDYINALCNLGVLYEKGKGFEQDYNKAREYKYHYDEKR